VWVSGGLGRLKNTEKTRRCILVGLPGPYVHMSSNSSSLYLRAPKSGVTTRACNRFVRGSLGDILWLINGEVASPSMGKKDGGEECSVAPLWVALRSVQSSSDLEDSVRFCLPLYRIRPPRINQGRSGTRPFGGLVYGLHASESRRALLWHGWTSALSWSQRSLRRLLAAQF
jgi:hypothetical protein